MNLLLDSHVVIWWLEDPARIAATARSAIADGRNRALVSVASIWEIGLKTARQKLTLPDGYVDLLQADGFSFLDIRREHAERAPTLPPHHGDPFDRMLIAQAMAENLVLVTSDAALRAYSVPILEA